MRKIYRTKDYTFITKKDSVKLYKEDNGYVVHSGSQQIGYYYYDNGNLYFNLDPYDSGLNISDFVEIYENADF